MTELEKHLAEYEKILDRQKFDESLLDYTILKNIVTTLRFLEEFEGNYYEIFDLYKREHLYFTSSFKEHFGFVNEKDFDDHIHPEDLIQLVKLGNYFMQFAIDTEPELRKEYKLCNEFRIMNRDGEYIRVVKQYRLLESDVFGNLWLSLGTLHLAPDNDPQSPVRSKLIHIPSGRATIYKIDTVISPKETPLSEREIEILAFIAKGFASKQIAEKLCLSSSTVNTHRQNIIRKLDVQNTVEAVQYAMGIGLIVA
ncbi:MAG: helix-turn-helix transcriptional regulator [Ignavibacteriales bacterium]|nr:helix-turn-helix transcriptional regulator [Ignavibacteriales bacterium]